MLQSIDMTRETIRVRGKGEITLPSDIRQQLGLEVGALLTAEVVGDGVLLKPAEVVAREAMAQISKELRAQGTTLEDLLAAGRKARAKVAVEKYGVKKPVAKSRRKRP
jgi:AbrB family looped-hinge helix DNA binding protein